jgi:hypothetical protein
MTNTEARRLRYLADKMAKLPKSAEEHFNMGYFFYHPFKHPHKFGKKIRRKDLTYCGTTACAWGWAATMPYFNKLGAHIDRENGISKWPERIFGHEAEFLFYDFSVETPKQWAATARKFLREQA